MTSVEDTYILVEIERPFECLITGEFTLKAEGTDAALNEDTLRAIWGLFAGICKYTEDGKRFHLSVFVTGAVLRNGEQMRELTADPDHPINKYADAYTWIIDQDLVDLEGPNNGG